MSKFAHILLAALTSSILAALGSPISAQPVASSSWANELYDRVRPSVVLVSTERGQGTGFLFHSNHHIATAFHVIAGGRNVYVTLSDGSTRTARVVAWDARLDLALLQLDAAINAPVLHAVRPGSGRVGDPVVAIGNPWGDEQRRTPDSRGPVWALSQGVISAPPADLIQTDAPVNPGNSGGPLLTREGEVVGVLVVRLAGSDGISFAVPTSRLAALVPRIGVQPEYRASTASFDLQLSWVPVAEHELSGILVGTRAVLASTWAVGLRGARLWGSKEVRSTLHLTERDRWLAEADVSYRLAGGDGGGMSAGLGVAYQHDAIVDRRSNIESQQLSEEKTKRNDDAFRLMLSASLEAEWLLADTALYMLGDEGFGARLGLGLVF